MDPGGEVDALVCFHIDPGWLQKHGNGLGGGFGLVDDPIVFAALIGKEEVTTLAEEALASFDVFPGMLSGNEVFLGLLVNGAESVSIFANPDDKGEAGA